PAAAMTAGSHGATFGRNPLAMAVGNAVLDVILADGFLGSVDAIARRLWERLEKLVADNPKVFEGISGAGLMIGLKCVPENLTVVGKLADAGLLAVGAGNNVLRFVPPLIIEDAHIDEAMGILEKVANELSQSS
ncbi:MAG: aminotransferase class III-fold pyridoxal phosphate-dependent enzyme, partial [Rhodospirillales bacterium]|nr:aminotransferase class III-fold pyridoxal phosphate-dependent enzyme [Rhodospirillales bacterium]